MVLYGDLFRPPVPRWWWVSEFCLTMGFPAGQELPWLDCWSLDAGTLSPQGSVWLAVCDVLRQDVGLQLSSRHRPRSRLVPTRVGAETAHRADLALSTLLSCHCTDLPLSSSGSGCRQEPDEVVDVSLGLCPRTWPQLPAAHSDSRQDGGLAAGRASWPPAVCDSS